MVQCASTMRPAMAMRSTWALPPLTSSIGGSGEPDQNIRVGIRVRPLTSEETAIGETSAWTIVRGKGRDDSSPDETASGDDLVQTGSAIHADRPDRLVAFRFRHVFGQDSSTQHVYDQLVRPIVQDAIQGINGAIFCYGQTSAGKTHTMTGTDNDPGIIPIALQHIFQAIQQCTHREFLLRFSYIEVYNEHVFDLLTDTDESLSLQEDKEKVLIKGLSEEILTSLDQVRSTLERGLQRRRVGQTEMNQFSSRSHVILRVSIESENPPDRELPDSRRKALVAHINFVDLAGSERIARAGASGVRYKEGTSINKSLLTLGVVIAALSRGASHAPFRDSRLTLILKHCLGGNARTAFIQCVTPALSCSEESISTLRLAKRVAHVKNSAQVNEVDCAETLLYSNPVAIALLRKQLSSSEKNHADQAVRQVNLIKQQKLLEIKLHQYKTLYMHSLAANNSAVLPVSVEEIDPVRKLCSRAEEIFQLCGQLHDNYIDARRKLDSTQVVNENLSVRVEALQQQIAMLQEQLIDQSERFQSRPNLPSIEEPDPDKLLDDELALLEGELYRRLRNVIQARTARNPAL